MAFVSEDTITDIVTARFEGAADRPGGPRMAKVMTSLVRHLHAFVRDVELTHGEWATAIDFLVRTGKLSSEKRNEMILLSDVLGISMLTTMLDGALPEGATPNTVTGPFHIEDSPVLPDGADMAGGAPGELCFIVGQVRDLDGTPVEGAELDVWQADEDGLYESQVAAAGPYLRGIYHSGPDGRFCIRTVVPCHYSIPMDGPVGELVRATGISHDRPAHVHLRVTAPGRQELITHLFRAHSDYIDSDAVYGVREKLIVDFAYHDAGVTPDGGLSETKFATVRFDVVLSAARAALAA
jgi:hydroxyquinol 1,2-dioxygenase